jgi:hypothetical protein
MSFHRTPTGLLFVFALGCGGSAPTQTNLGPIVGVRLSKPDVAVPTFPTPDAPPGYLTPAPPGSVAAWKEADTDPIPQDRDLAKRRTETLYAWHRAATVGVFETRGKSSAPWAAQARAALDSTARVLSLTGHRKTEAEQDRDHALVAAVEARCDDPQLRYYHLKFVRDKDCTDPNAVREYARLADQFDAEKYSAHRRLHARWNACARAASAVPDPEKPLPSPTNRRPSSRPRVDVVALYEPVWGVLTELAADRDPECERTVVEIAKLIGHVYDESGRDRKEGFDRVAKALTAGKANAWVRNLVEGQFLMEYAWDARGDDFAVAVPAEAWPVFHDRLTRAGTALRDAWDEDRTRPEPAVEMLTVALGLGFDKDDMEVWFRRAMTADPDCYDACRAKLYFLDPKWHGSHAEMVAFGRQCARTQNWDADLPLILVEAHAARGNPDLDGPSFAPPEVWADMREAFEPQLVRDPDDRFARTVYGKLCVAAGRYGSAYFHFTKLNEQPWTGPSTFPDVDRFRRQVDLVRMLYAESLRTGK